jgi:predicted CXXCH cytochrome family protein
MVKSIPLLLITALFLLPSSAQAITRRADKECLLCHVLWFDAFKTDQETLIEKRDSSIVIAGSVGLASSEEMCVTCHDGYVVDSRVKIVEGNPHYVLKKPPDGLNLPEIFRLDRNNEIYCGTCHTLHDMEDRAEVGSTPFLRTGNERSQMCISCHDGKTGRQGYSNHPVLEEATDIPRFEATRKGSKFGPAREIICQSCHNAHGKDALVLPLNNSTLCLICHENKKSLINGKHDLRVTLPGEKNIKNQRPSESGPCSSCHIPHNGAGKKLWARRLNPGDPAAQMCLICHDEKTGVKTKRIGTHSHPTNVKLVSKGAPPKDLPLFLADTTKDPAGKVQCFTCHNAHQWDPNSPANTGGKNVEGDASNSFLRIPNNISSTLCVACHLDKKQVITSDHNLEVTAPEEKNVQKVTARVSGPCGACHLPHNAAGKKLWARPLSGEQNFVTQLCVGCHNKKGAAKAKLIGDNYHPVDVTFEKLNTTGPGEQAIAGLPLYGSDGERIPAGNLVCLTCHEPHTWDPKKLKAVSNYELENMEGDTTNSFLRKPNFPSSELCKTCHLDQARVDGTDHDLNVSAPKATNLLDQTVQASGQCGVCHLVHNSPNQLKLWARPYGPIPKNQNIMSGLCTSCHSKENSAEKKVPPIASHPTGKLINNIIRYGTEKGGYTPIFDESGKEKNVGDISCPSCHNVHKWSTAFEERGGQEDAGGNATETFRFLRIMSYNTVCSNCHGPDSLFRYLYFHDPDKRPRALRPTTANKILFPR